jgi:thiamine pyrophosphate-dependent acetolactate synthase large subunit-like protein
MCVQELSTCLQYNTPVKIVALNKAGSWAWFVSGKKLNTLDATAAATWTLCLIS